MILIEAQMSATSLYVINLTLKPVSVSPYTAADTWAVVFHGTCDPCVFFSSPETDEKMNSGNVSFYVRVSYSCMTQDAQLLTSGTQYTQF